MTLVLHQEEINLFTQSKNDVNALKKGIPRFLENPNTKQKSF